MQNGVSVVISTPCPLRARRRRAAGGAGRSVLGCIPPPDVVESTEGEQRRDKLVFFFFPSLQLHSIDSIYDAALHKTAHNEFARLLRCILGEISAAEHKNKAGFSYSEETNNLLWTSLPKQTYCLTQAAQTRTMLTSHSS